MPKLISGNAAIARGLYEAGVSFVSSYPGTPSTEITEEACKYSSIYTEWAPNEKVAVESSFGACLAGKRSFSAMKHVGLNVAADPVFTISYTGVNAGMVIVVADDPAMHSSQNEQDSRMYAASAQIPMLEPADSSECLGFTKLAYKLSEKFDTPILIKTCTRIAHSKSLVEFNECDSVGQIAYEKNPSKYVMMPAMAYSRHVELEKRKTSVQKWAESTYINRIEQGSDSSLGFVTSSTSYQYVKEVFGDKYPVLKLGMIYPLPDNKILQFASQVGRLIVVEELFGFIENHIKTLNIECRGKQLFSAIGELSPNKIAKALDKDVHKTISFPQTIANRPPTLCAGCPHRGIFYTLKKKNVTVFGDIGCYTLGCLPPLSALDVSVCMGSSISGLHGFNKADRSNNNKSVAVIGDSTFIHSGITSLINVAYNQSNSCIVILDNSITGMTGHQQNPSTGLNIKGEPTAKVSLEKLCNSIGIEDVAVVDPYNLDECMQAIDKALCSDNASVIISRRPCALLKGVKHPYKIESNLDRCIGCRACMKLGCPAISFDCDKVKIDTNLCIGCGMCSQVCKKNALQIRKDH